MAVNNMLSKLQKTPSSPKSEYTMRITAYNPEDGLRDPEPSLCLYRSEDQGVFHPLHGPNETKLHGKTVWACVVSVIEVKVHPLAAPFNFDSSSLELNTNSRKDGAGPRARAQMANYATEIHRQQHRTAVFTAFVFRDWVRFIRWDRAGALISHAYNYVCDPVPFLKFFYLLAMSDPGKQGYNTMFKQVNPRDVSLELLDYISQVQGGEDPRNKWYRRVGRGLGLDPKGRQEQALNARVNPLYTVRPLWYSICTILIIYYRLNSLRSIPRTTLPHPHHLS